MVKAILKLVRLQDLLKRVGHAKASGQSHVLKKSMCERYGAI